ncbi:MAG: IS200/IS605 family element transposase accessory protein TnpB [Candidatus Aenigmarchaeota archaeon]|nr:IS200/IS605 family element transposase accessory protein TnpB [Candidatus Aenigmarchaeota archaeon]
MILTYKIRHNRDFGKELLLAKKVAEFGIKHRTISSKDVRHIGLKSIIANQILLKYSKNRKARKVNNVKLTIPNQGIRIIDDKIYTPSLKLWLDVWFDKEFKKINQIEIGDVYAYISVNYDEPKTYTPETVIGVDRNSTGHILVASNINTGKVLKLGKSCNHIHNKYKNIRKVLQKQGKFKKLKKIKDRENRIIKDINHKVTTTLVKYAKEVKSGIVLEKLDEIRKTAKTRRKQRYSLNSWSFYQQQQMIEYKSKKFGVPVFYVEPQYTSQRCSRCGHIENANRNGNLFHCKNCGTVENAGVNAGFNIAWLHQQGISQFCKERDLQKGNTDIPKEALLNPEATLEPHAL